MFYISNFYFRFIPDLYKNDRNFVNCIDFTISYENFNTNRFLGKYPLNYQI